MPEVRLLGVNRHESHPLGGIYLSQEQLEVGYDCGIIIILRVATQVSLKPSKTSQMPVPSKMVVAQIASWHLPKELQHMPGGHELAERARGQLRAWGAL